MATDEPDPTDRLLVARMARGDDAALGALYDRHGALAYALALRILVDPAEAEEAVSDAFLQIWRQAAEFDAERGRVATWVVMITRSRALDLHRARKRRALRTERSAAGGAAVAAPAVPPDHDPGRHAEAADVRAAVTAALAELPAEQRRALELAYFGGLSHSEIARTLEEPVGTVKSRIRAGMEKLRGLLAAYS